MLGVHDRIGGKEVREAEFRDLRHLTDENGLFEIDSQREKFTWFNKHSHDPIYPCIDRVLGNMDWISKNKDKFVHVLEPGVSDHALICIKSDDVRKKNKSKFKFINVVIGSGGYHEVVRQNWHRQVK